MTRWSGAPGRGHQYRVVGGAPVPLSEPKPLCAHRCPQTALPGDTTSRLCPWNGTTWKKWKSCGIILGVGFQAPTLSHRQACCSIWGGHWKQDGTPGQEADPGCTAWGSHGAPAIHAAATGREQGSNCSQKAGRSTTNPEQALEAVQGSNPSKEKNWKLPSKACSREGNLCWSRSQRSRSAALPAGLEGLGAAAWMLLESSTGQQVPRESPGTLQSSAGTRPSAAEVGNGLILALGAQPGAIFGKGWAVLTPQNPSSALLLSPKSGRKGVSWAETHLRTLFPPGPSPGTFSGMGLS